MIFCDNFCENCKSFYLIQIMSEDLIRKFLHDVSGVLFDHVQWDEDDFPISR